MKRTLTAVTLMGIAALGFGCSNKNPGSPQPNQGEGQPVVTHPVTPEQPTPGPRTDLAWKLSFKAECGDNISATDCIGAYGFVLHSDGSFQVGPGPENQTKTGSLSAEEIDNLRQGLLKAIGTGSLDSLGTAEACTTLAQAGGKHSLIVNQEGVETQIAHADGESFCFVAADGDSARSLNDIVLVLARKYYRLPFPDACADAVEAVTQLYASVQGCNTDADCSYVNMNHEPIPGGSSQFVMTDSCLLFKPLAVANSAKLISNQGRINDLIGITQQACGARFIRSGCMAVSGFTSTEAAPVCQQNVCRINPTIALGAI